MNFKELECFQIICEEKSITKAARRLYITPQGLSKTLRNLEYEFQIPLVNRNSTGITLTEAGQYLYEQLPGLMSHYYGIYNHIQRIRQNHNHEIDLLSAYGILRLVTPDCLREFQSQHPEIILHYREYPDKQVERLFSNKEGNLAFCVGPSDFSGFHAEKMESFEIKLLVYKEHPLAAKDSVTIMDLKDQPLYIENSEFNIHHLITSKCRAAGFTPNIIFETSGFSLCHKMVKRRKGISVTVDFIYDDMQDENLVMVPFSDGQYLWSTYILTRTDEKISPDTALFLKHVMTWINDIKNGRRRR